MFKKLRILLLRFYHSTALRLALTAFVIYNINLRSVTSLDTYPTRYLPISIIKEFNFDLDEFYFLHQYPASWFDKYGNTLEGGKVGKNQIPYYLKYGRGHYMSSYPVMPSILSVPVYVLPVLLGLTEGSVTALDRNQTEIVGTFLSKMSASLAVAFSVGIVYLTLRHFTTKRASFWIAFTYGFACSSWAVSSQGLWQSSMSQPLLALAFYFFVRARQNPKHIQYAGIPLAVAVACHPPAIIFAFIFFIYVLHKYRAQVLHFMIFPTIIGALLLAYNYYYFGSLTGAYAVSESYTNSDDQAIGQTNNKLFMTTSDITHPRLKWLLGLLISPGRGLLVYSPYLIFSLLGLLVVLYRGRDHLLIYISIATILTLLLYSSWFGWHGAFNYSYRLLVDLLPGLSLLLVPVLSWIIANRYIKVLFITLVAFSVLIQIIGAFFYPCGWYDNAPISDRITDKIYWNWRDPEFLRCLANGPVEPDGLSFIKEILEKK